MKFFDTEPEPIPKRLTTQEALNIARVVDAPLQLALLPNVVDADLRSKRQHGVSVPSYSSP